MGDTITPNEATRIQAIIDDTTYYDLTSGNKFFVEDKFYRTEFTKTSYSSMRAKKYFELIDVDRYEKAMGAKEVADLLNGKTWK